jgi:GNAT superfamily N-acetyltransferase
VAIMVDWGIRPASVSDVAAVAELRAVVLRADLERLGRYDAQRVRQRLRDGFEPAHTWVIEVGGAFAGSVALRPAKDSHWLEHFYLASHLQGSGIGSGVLQRRPCPIERSAGQPGPTAVRAARVHARDRGSSGRVHGAQAGL